MRSIALIRDCTSDARFALKRKRSMNCCISALRTAADSAARAALRDRSARVASNVE